MNKSFQTEILEKSIIQKGNLLKSCFDEEIFKSWSGDLQKRFPNAEWKTINGAKVLMNGSKVVAGLEGFNGMIDDFFEKDNKGNSKLKESIKKTESEILKKTKNKYEALVFLDKNGKSVVGMLEGNKNSVTIPDDAVSKIKESDVFTHNHPSSRAFSFPDIMLALRHQIGSCRAIAPNSIAGEGTWVFENSKNRKIGSAQANLRKIQDQINEVMPETRDFFSDYITKGKYQTIDDRIDIANSLDGIVILMQTDLYKKMKADLYFETENGEKKKIVDILKEKGADISKLKL